FAVSRCCRRAGAGAGLSFRADGGQSGSSEKGAIDCTNKRVIGFTSNPHTDSNGGVPAFRNQSVVTESPSSFRIVDEFSTGQISAAHTTVNHVELVMEPGPVKSQRCK